jgi:hypothetical protein
MINAAARMVIDQPTPPSIQHPDGAQQPEHEFRKCHDYD